MWEGIEARIAENDAEQFVPFRRELLEVLQASEVRPISEGATKKLVGMELSSGERLVWEVERSATGFFVAQKWSDALSRAGFSPAPRPFQSEKKDGGRHSGLNRTWSFAGEDCLQLTVGSAADLVRLIKVLGGVAKPTLAPAAITRWIARLRRFFPHLDRFDRPDPDFDARERDYKLQVAERMRAAIASAKDDAAVLAAVHEGLAKSNLLPWRAFWSMSAKGDGDVARLAPALHALVMAAQGPAESHPQALADFANVWAEAVPNPQRDHPRQIGEFVLMHLAPESGVYIRHTVREDFWREGYGTKFPASTDLAETYRNERQFMQAVQEAFVARGLAPRDLIDIQSALWVVHNYTDNDAETSALPETEMSDVTPPTNLILYGPPGTGKTWATAWEAVRLCLGAAAEPLRSDREALMAEYRRLCDEGRIEFTTFHQSMSYEDFVEGLRPETGEGESNGSSEGGFRLEPRDGIFRRISLRAEASRAPTSRAITLDGRSVFKMSIGNSMLAEDAPLFDEAISGGYAVFGFADIDWSDARFADRAAILESMTAADYEAGGTRTVAARMTDIFRNRIKPGDVIVVTRGNRFVRAVGLVTGDYQFVPRSEGDYAHRRGVEWLWHDRDGLPAAEIYNRQISQRTLYPLALEDINQPALLRALNASQDEGVAAAEPFVLIIDEINRANISKVFGELITLLEADKRLGAENEIRLRLPYSGRLFGVPANLHIIGTMNTADRSIALLDTALRRRFSFRELMPDPAVLPENCEGVNLQRLLATLNARIEYLFDREHQIGHAYFTGCSTRESVEAVMRHKVIPLLAEYFYEDWAKVAAVLGDGPGRAARFLQAEVLTPPPGLAEEEMGAERLRWQVCERFDLSDFAD